MVIVWFKVIQGHQFQYRWKVHATFYVSTTVTYILFFTVSGALLVQFTLLTGSEPVFNALGETLNAGQQNLV